MRDVRPNAIELNIGTVIRTDTIDCRGLKKFGYEQEPRFFRRFLYSIKALNLPSFLSAPMKTTAALFVLMIS
jgi:hypothetical protein